MNVNVRNINGVRGYTRNDNSKFYYSQVNFTCAISCAGNNIPIPYSSYDNNIV